MVKKNIQQTPKVSVIIPVYNVEKYLPQCLNSILEQTLQDIEVICVDDGSSDNSLNILNTYQKKDKRITVLTQKNRFAGVARNTGMAVAKGKYLCFLDSDDFFEKNMLAEMYDKAEEDASDVVVCGYWQYNQELGADTSQHIPDKQYVAASPVRPTECGYNLFNRCYSTPWTKLFRHDLFVKNHLQFENLQKCNDLTCIYAALSLAQKISFIDKLFVHYRWNTGAQLSSTRFGQNDYFIYAAAALEKNLQKLNLYDEFYEKMLYALSSSLEWETNGNIKLLRNTGKQNLSARLYKDMFCSKKFKKMKEQLATKWVCKIKFLFFLSVFSRVTRGDKTVWHVCGIPVLKRRKMENGITTKYYIMGIPFIKISNKIAK